MTTGLGQVEARGGRARCHLLSVLPGSVLPSGSSSSESDSRWRVDKLSLQGVAKAPYGVRR